MILRYQLYFGILVLSLFFSWRVVGRKFGFLAFLALSYVLISAINVFQWAPIMNDEFYLRLRSVSAASFAEIAMLVYFISSLRPRHIDWIISFFEVVLVVDLFVYLFNSYGIFNSGSMDMSFMAMAYPLLAFRPIYSSSMLRIYWRLFLQVFPLLCLFFGIPGSACYMALASGIGAYLILNKKWKSAACSAVAVIGAGIFVLSHYDGFFSQSGRFEVWKLLFNWWKVNASWLLGTGTGTFQWIGPTLQINADPNQVHGFFIFMHSDYLQVLFEQGIVGLVLVLIMSMVCIYRSVRYPWLFASCLSSVVVLSLQFPLRFLFSQLLILILMRLCLDEESLNQIENP